MSASSEIWDKRYSTEEFVYGKDPNKHFSERLSEMQPGRILLPAEGEGRNAVYAATKGWEVYAFDQSVEGYRKALKLAAMKNVSINYNVTDASEAVYPMNHFDVIALYYAHFDSMIRRELHRKFITFLKPGGTIMLEGFSKGHLAYRKNNPNAGGPVDESLLFSTDTLKTDFDKMQITDIREIEFENNEGSLHRGLSLILRMTAIKV